MFRMAAACRPMMFWGGVGLLGGELRFDSLSGPPLPVSYPYSFELLWWKSTQVRQPQSLKRQVSHPKQTHFVHPGQDVAREQPLATFRLVLSSSSSQLPLTESKCRVRKPAKRFGNNMCIQTRKS
jgi:hypothetical protein